MKITCSKCSSSFNIPDNKIPAKKAKARCTKCGADIIIDPVDAFLDSFSQDGTPTKNRQEILFSFPELSVPAFSKCNLASILIPNKKGSYKTGRNRFKVKVLKSVSYLLEKVIAHGEQVFRVAHGVAYFPSEVFFGNGLLTMLMNHYAIFATDRRLIFININSRISKPTHLFFQLPYENIDKMKFGKIFGSITMKSVKGKRRTFTYMKRYLVQELKEFLNNKLSTVTTTSKGMAQPENICPSCFLPVVDGQKQCPHCEAQYKTPWAAFSRSLLLPGWGDLYLGHKGLGLLELLGTLIFWGLMVSLVLDSMANGDQAELMTNSIIAGGFLAFYHIGDAVLTFFMGKKGYMIKK